jgi:hypothetical protein
VVSPGTFRRLGSETDVFLLRAAMAGLDYWRSGEANTSFSMRTKESALVIVYIWAAGVLTA